jgi:hypothetical protein
MRPKLEFDAAAHVYTLNGERVPSVTEILSPLEDLSSIPANVLERARIRGQHVHQAMALLVRDELDWHSLDADLVPYIIGGRRFLEESGITVIASEMPVACPKLRVAGTLDLFGHWRDSDALLDFKATASMPASVGPQTAGYETLYRSQFGGRQRKRFCVQLKPNDYRIYPLTDSADYSIFTSALNIFHWRNKHAAA